MEQGLSVEQFYLAYRETIAHKRLVNELMAECAQIIMARGIEHDDSKLSEEEFELFAELTPKLKSSTYNSAEYQEFKDKLKPALDHHYANNRHHPEHYKNGIRDMTLFDVLEEVVDWCAASKRQSNGNIRKSLEHNKALYHFSDDLMHIIENTVEMFDK